MLFLPIPQFHAPSSSNMMMMRVISDSDVTSSTPSSPRSPKRPLYDVQSPSRDSSSTRATPAFNNSPLDSLTHPSYTRTSNASSSTSRVSGPFRSVFGRKGNRECSDKRWPAVIKEEGDYDDFYGHQGLSRNCQILVALLGVVLVFFLFCLIIWGATRPFKPHITVQGMTVHNVYYGEGSDTTGVPTKLLTTNCSLRITVYNPATFFGIHVSFSPVNLMYSEIVVATGQLKKYYQPRQSNRVELVNLQGNKVPLYGAGTSLEARDKNGNIPMVLVFEVHSRGNVVGKLVKSKHRKRIACSLDIDSRNSKPMKIKADSCAYD